jgi:hypothetical protein
MAISYLKAQLIPNDGKDTKADITVCNLQSDNELEHSNKIELNSRST